VAPDLETTRREADMSTPPPLPPDMLFWTTIVLSLVLLGIESAALRYLSASHPRAWEMLGRRRALNRSLPEHFSFAAYFWSNRHRQLADPVVNGLGALLRVVAAAVLLSGVWLYAVAG
jgi:hypothetical protein